MLEAIAQRTGHALCECPTCHERRFCAYRPKSQKWPICDLCRSGARLVPNDNLHLVRKNPGKPRTRKQLIEDGYVRRLPPPAGEPDVRSPVGAPPGAPAGTHS